MALSKREQNTGAVVTIFAITLFLVYLSFPIFGLGNELIILGGIAGNFLLATCICIVVLRKYRNAGNPAMIDYLNVGIQRYILALMMVFYGIDKLVGNFFDYQLFALDSKLIDVSEFQLAWFFYGKNRWQELFTGIMEFVPALFLMRRRTYYIASIILLPVTAQVFLLNLFFKIGGVTFPAATVLLACNMYIIYSQREKIVLFFKSLDFNRADPANKTKAAIKIMRRVGIFLACFLVFVKVKPAFFKSAYQHKYQGLVGVYSLTGMKKNNVTCQPGADSLCYKDLYIEKQDRWNILRRTNNSIDAFVLKLNTHSDSIGLYINKGGTGDGPLIVDSATALKGVYRMEGNLLKIKGIQLKDTLELTYEKQGRIVPKKWFW